MSIDSNTIQPEKKKRNVLGFSCVKPEGHLATDFSTPHGSSRRWILLGIDQQMLGLFPLPFLEDQFTQTKDVSFGYILCQGIAAMSQRGSYSVFEGRGNSCQHALALLHLTVSGLEAIAEAVRPRPYGYEACSARSRRAHDSVVS